MILPNFRGKCPFFPSTFCAFCNYADDDDDDEEVDVGECSPMVTKEE